MAFGKRLPASGAERGRRSLFLYGLLASLLALILSGCGGGSDGGNNNVPNPNNPIITGRVLDQYSNNAPVEGATVVLRRSNGQTIATTQTNASGTFTFQINPTTESTFLTVTAPAGTNFYSQGYVNGVAVNIQTGITIPAQALSATYDVGGILVATESGGPPPPPF